MKNSPHISVIVPNYCHARFLEQRIQSILNQTFQDFELIILDDCSPDDGASRAVIEKYRDNPHVSHIVYNEMNSGSTFRQWDKGISLAKGSLIWIAESDDFCEPTLLDILVREFIMDGKLTLAYTLSQKVDVDGISIPYLCRTPTGVTRLDGHDYIRRYMTTCNHCVNASAVLFRKESWEKMNRMYNTFKAGGDMLFWIEIAEQGNVAIVNKRLNYFRQHPIKVTPNASHTGVNIKEFKKTYEYLATNLNFSQMRLNYILNHVHYMAISRTYASEEIRKDVLNFWRMPHDMSFIKRIICKFGEILQQRLNIYL